MESKTPAGFGFLSTIFGWCKNTVPVCIILGPMYAIDLYCEATSKANTAICCVLFLAVNFEPYRLVTSVILDAVVVIRSPPQGHNMFLSHNPKLGKLRCAAPGTRSHLSFLLLLLRGAMSLHRTLGGLAIWLTLCLEAFPRETIGELVQLTTLTRHGSRVRTKHDLYANICTQNTQKKLFLLTSDGE